MMKKEKIWANVTDIGNHLIGLVSAPAGWRSHKHKMPRKWSARIERMARIEARLLRLDRQMTFSFASGPAISDHDRCIPRIARRSVGRS
jgi:hypothetical protein